MVLFWSRCRPGVPVCPVYSKTVTRSCADQVRAAEFKGVAVDGAAGEHHHQLAEIDGRVAHGGFLKLLLQIMPVNIVASGQEPAEIAAGWSAAPGLAVDGDHLANLVDGLGV